MGFNPRGKRRPIDAAPLDIEPTVLLRHKGTPCIVLTQGQLRVARAKNDAKFSEGKLVPAPPTHKDTVRRLSTGPMEVYIEWWKLGTKEGDINCGTFSTINIKHFCKTFARYKHLSMIFMRRECDQKVIYDRRTS
jgi:hypothetical protein